MYFHPFCWETVGTGAGPESGVAGAHYMTGLEEVAEPLHHQPFTWGPTSRVLLGG